MDLETTNRVGYFVNLLSKEITIYGLNLPANDDFLLAKLWSGIRRKCRDKYGVDAIAFFWKNASGDILCKFQPFLPTGKIQSTDPEVIARAQDQAAVEEWFADHFERISITFTDAVQKFVEDDEQGLAAYAKLVATSASTAELTRLLNGFLRSIKIRTLEDDQRSARENQTIHRASRRAQRVTESRS